jgi:hypothetical protein
MAENKSKPTKLSVAGFIDALPEPTRRADAICKTSCSTTSTLQNS